MTDALHTLTFENPHRPLWLRGVNWAGETLKQNKISLVGVAERVMI